MDILTTWYLHIYPYYYNSERLYTWEPYILSVPAKLKKKKFTDSKL